jgi:hypothetical protein
MNQSWHSRLLSLIEPRIVISEGSLCTTKEHVTVFHSSLTFLKSRKLSARHLDRISIALDGPIDGSLDIHSLLSVLRSRGAVVSDVEWQALINDFRMRNGIEPAEQAEPIPTVQSQDDVDNTADADLSDPALDEHVVVVVADLGVQKQQQVDASTQTAKPSFRTLPLTLQRHIGKLRIAMEFKTPDPLPHGQICLFGHD